MENIYEILSSGFSPIFDWKGGRGLSRLEESWKNYVLQFQKYFEIIFVDVEIDIKILLLY